MKEESSDYLEVIDDNECPICMENKKEFCITKCNHSICTACTREIYRRNGNNTECPSCKANIDFDKLDLFISAFELQREISVRGIVVQPERSNECNPVHIRVCCWLTASCFCMHLILPIH